MNELTCRAVIDHLADYFDDTLAPLQRVAFDAHLASCDDCLTYLRQYGETLALVRQSR